MKVVNHTNYDTRALRGIFAAVHVARHRIAVIESLDVDRRITEIENMTARELLGLVKR